MSGTVNTSQVTKNAALLYIRMAVMMVVSIYTSRVILEVLGVEDFGIYNVVWGITSVIVFFSGSLGNAAQRYLNIGLGKENLTRTSQYFNQFVLIFALFSVLLITVGEFCANWVVEDLLVIPSQRISAAKWVYQNSLICLVLTFFVIPYNSSIIAHERMDIFAFITLFDTFARLGILYLIQLFNGDYLVFYAFALSIVKLATTLFYILYCKYNFEECVHFFYFEKKLLKEMFSFIGYNIYGCFAFSMSQQGINVLLNIFFGPVINAARAIAQQVYGAVYSFSDNILMAVRPPITKQYALDAKDKMVEMATNTVRYCLYINALIVLPIVFNIDTILQIWLGTVPDYTGIFVIVVLIESYINILCQMQAILVNATGNLKWNQFYGRTFTLLSLPLAYIALFIWENPIVPIAITLLCNIGYAIIGQYDIRRQLKVSILNFAKETIWSVILLHIILVSVLFIIKILIEGRGMVLFFSIITDILLGCSVIYKFFLKQKEREYILSIINKFH